MAVASKIEPIVKSMTLGVSAEKAFHHFTNNIHLWWPLTAHSLSGPNAVSVVFEAKAGGRIYEIDNSGKEREWGRILICEAPHRVVFSWILEEPEKRTEIEVRIDPLGDGACQLTLRHYGWDKRPDGAQTRDYYNEGWDPVLGDYVKALN